MPPIANRRYRPTASRRYACIGAQPLGCSRRKRRLTQSHSQAYAFSAGTSAGAASWASFSFTSVAPLPSRLRK
jgi:hypothetical protein